MSTHLLSRRPPAPRACLSPLPGVDLPLARAHEVCGAARWSFALWLATAIKGPILWIAPAWAAAQMNPDGISDFTDPGRFLFVSIDRVEDTLWATEEALRSGAVPFVVADLLTPPPMTPVRRLHLAAEQGGQSGPAPLALLLTPDTGGAQGIESRWHFSPCHEGEQRIWSLTRLRARTQPVRTWQLTQPEPRAPLVVLNSAAPAE